MFCSLFCPYWIQIVAYFYYFRIDAPTFISYTFDYSVYCQYVSIRMMTKWTLWNPLHLINMTCATSNKIDPDRNFVLHLKNTQPNCCITQRSKRAEKLKKQHREEKTCRLSENVIRKWIERATGKWCNCSIDSVIKRIAIYMACWQKDENENLKACAPVCRKCQTHSVVGRWSNSLDSVCLSVRTYGG